MIIAIDACNVSNGGGLKVLEETFGTDINPKQFGIDSIIIYTAANLKIDKPWLKIIKTPLQSIFSLKFLFFRLFLFPNILKSNCNLVYSPTALYPGNKVPFVCASQNMLAFEKIERNRFPFSQRIKYIFINITSIYSFKKSTANIFLTTHSKNLIYKSIPTINHKPHAIIPLGCSARFITPPKTQKNISHYSKNKPFKILYVSIINFYKHQREVILAIQILIKKNYPVELDLIGPANPKAFIDIEHLLITNNSYIHYHKDVSYHVIDQYYRNADIFLFNSTCETMPNILLEAMSAGLPIISSSYGPMKEILHDSAIYCDPLDPEDISDKLEYLLLNPEMRENIALKSYNLSKNYSWESTAKLTYSFLSLIANSIKH